MSDSRPETSSEIQCAVVRHAHAKRERGQRRVGCGMLAERFRQVARSAARRSALKTSRCRWTYGDLTKAAMSVASTLRASRSFRAGDRVVLTAPNSAAYVVGFYGTLFAGGVVVPVPVDMETERLQSILDVTEASHVLSPAKLLGRLPVSVEETLQTVDVKVPGSFDAPDRVIESADGCSDPDALAAIFFTSGSSGRPKGVMLSHRNLLSNAESIQKYLQIDHTERALAVLPFPHAFGNSVLQSHLLAGAELVLEGSTMFPESILDALVNYECTSFSAVPDLYQTLCERTSLGERSLPRLRYMAVAGGALPHGVAQGIAHRIAPARFFTMYGQTEATARLAYLPPEQLTGRPGCLGQGIPGVQLQVVDDRGDSVAAGDVGEIRARGPNIMLGYWRDPEATAEILRNGWLHTGDLATVDDDGRIYVRGRKNAIIKIAGYRIHPREIEEFVLAHCPVRQAVVVPFESPQSGAVRLALFVLPTLESSQRLTEAQLLSICRNHLPGHRVPGLVQILSKFPLTSSMKIDRPRLIDTAGALVSERLRVA